MQQPDGRVKRIAARKLEKDRFAFQAGLFFDPEYAFRPYGVDVVSMWCRFFEQPHLYAPGDVIISIV
jgi:hypothetical protein